MKKICRRVFDFLYSCALYKRTVAYRKLFPGGHFLDPETPYVEEVELIRKAIRYPSFRLEEMDMGIVLSQLIQSETISYSEGREICATLNDRYTDEIYYMNRRNTIRAQLDYFEENTSKVKN